MGQAAADGAAPVTDELDGAGDALAGAAMLGKLIAIARGGDLDALVDAICDVRLDDAHLLLSVAVQWMSDRDAMTSYMQQMGWT